MPRPLRIMLISLGALVVAVSIVTAAFVGLVYLSKHDVTAQRSFPLSGATLDVTSDSAALTFVPGAPDGTVEVDRRTTQSIRGAHPAWSLTDGHLKLRTNCPGFLDLSCGGEYTVHVPAGVSVRAVNGNGSVEADGMRQNVDLTTGNGTVSVTGTTADTVRLRSSNGSVDAQGVTARTVDAGTSNGNVTVHTVNAPDSLVAESSNGSVKVLLPGDQGSYNASATTSNGSTKVTVPTDPNAPHRVVANTGNGNVDVRLG